MLRNVLLTALAVVIAIFGGAGSVWYALSAQQGVGALTVGPWTTYPELGTPHADPYSKARVAREGVLALGRAEGLIFVAATDSTGVGLRRECSYTIEGTMPPARFWTLFAADGTMTPLARDDARPAATHSQEVLRRPGNVVAVTLSRHAAPGNWIATAGSGAMTVVLTLYDTPVAGGTGMAEIQLPQLVRGACDA
jgi:hypothetical protein